MGNEFISDVVCSAISFIGVIGMIGVVVMFESYQNNTERIIELCRYQEQELQQNEAALGQVWLASLILLALAAATAVRPHSSMTLRS